MVRRFLLGLALVCALATGCSSVPTITPTQAAGAPDGAASGESASGLGAQSLGTNAGMTRGEAVDQFSELAFLPIAESACVIDALHESAGTYDFTDPAAAEQVKQAGLMEICTGAQVNADDTTSNTDDGGGQSASPSFEGVAELMSETGALQVADADEATLAFEEPSVEESTAPVPEEAAPPVEAVEAPQPASLAPGSITTGTVELAGTNVGYAVVTPAGFTVGSSAPVLIALPDNGENVTDTMLLTDAMFTDAAVARGWVLVSPSLPGRDWTDSRNPALIADLTDWIETWVQIEGGKPHLGGFGGGGSGAFAVAAQNPSQFRSLMVYPGQPPEPVTSAAANLAQLPVRMWVVNNEGNRWITGMSAADGAIRAAGGNVVLNAISLEDAVMFVDDSGLGHMIFDELQSLR